MHIVYTYKCINIFIHTYNNPRQRRTGGAGAGGDAVHGPRRRSHPKTLTLSNSSPYFPTHRTHLFAPNSPQKSGGVL